MLDSIRTRIVMFESHSIRIFVLISSIRVEFLENSLQFVESLLTRKRRLRINRTCCIKQFVTSYRYCYRRNKIKHASLLFRVSQRCVHLCAFLYKQNTQTLFFLLSKSTHRRHFLFLFFFSFSIELQTFP